FGPRRAAQPEHLRQLPTHAERRVHGAAGVLVHHRDVVQAVLPERLTAEREHVAAADLDLAARHAAVPGQVVDRRERDGRLAAAGLPDEPVALLLPDLEADPADDLAVAAADAVRDLDVPQGQRGRRLPGFGNRAHSSSTCCTVSAIRLMATTSDAIASAGKTTAHHASVTSAYWSAICRPQSGEGGC